MENLKSSPLVLEEKPVKKTWFSRKKIVSIFLGVAILIILLVSGVLAYSELSNRYCPGPIIVNQMPGIMEFESTSPSTYWIKDGVRQEMSEYPKNVPFFCNKRKSFVS